MASYVEGLVRKAEWFLKQADACDTAKARLSARLYRRAAADRLEQAADLILVNN